MASSEVSELFDLDQSFSPIAHSHESSHPFRSPDYEGPFHNSEAEMEAGPSRFSPSSPNFWSDESPPNIRLRSRSRSRSGSNLLPILTSPYNSDNILTSPLSSTTSGALPLPSNRRRNLEALDIQQGDTRGLSEILTERRNGRNQHNTQNDFASGSQVVPRRRSLIEIQDDSDDDIVFTGENINPNPPLVQTTSHPREDETRRDRIVRATRRPSPNRFRRMMDEIDELVQQRGEAHDAIINDQQDERRRAILSPPAPLPPPGTRPRIGLGGGGLYRRGQVTRPLTGVADRNERHQDYRDIPDLNMVENVVEPGILQRIMAARRIRDGSGIIAGGAEGLELGLGFGQLAGWNLGGLAGGGPADIGLGLRREEDVQTILSKVSAPKYPEPDKGFTTDFDMDNISNKEPIELDDDGNIIKRNKVKPSIICISCSSKLLVSSAYKSEEDRIWVLRCGHLIEQKCLNRIQTPTTNSEILSIIKQADNDLLGDNHMSKRRKNAKRKVKKVEIKQPDEYTYRCPIEGCGKKHKSIFVGEKWMSKDGEGAIAAYA
ncbi:uncharacterized protein I206_105313 [Kwoniella pini CBS 10737]|uniref:Uncharacterized protein n=1 Tax=Kwoniella pini CBS 10737 TaxID=1296096 RepID=A0A1B9I4K4_9TREE|nr:uncharacterized protein I206_03777 [Kwoniella pini CBS 10737]OCF50455.1 hypothetical protein I206_03777 [Kwoniella pini CBS 10737]